MASPATFQKILLVSVCALLSQSAAQCLSDDDGTLKVSEERRQELLQSQLQFSSDLLHAVTNSLDSSDNVFFSPTSVYNALLLAYFVSATHTQDSLKEFLQIPQEQDKLDTFGAYSLEKYDQKLRSIKGSQKYQLSSANRVFVSSKQKIRPCIKNRFNDEIESLDFNDNASAAIKRINNWVSVETRNSIKDLLTPDAINSNTNLVLVNAAYFRGFWKFKFSSQETKESTFILSNGTTTTATMMTLEGKFNHKIDELLEAEVLELPYEGDDISMFIILPLENSVSAIMDLVNKTDAETLLNVINSLSNTTEDVSVAIPKFSIDQTLELTEVLESMGVGDLFRSSADLSTLTGDNGLRLDTIIHRAKVAVDESGTEAAAATAIFANRFASDSFIANHPFVFFLFHKNSNTLLFTGVFNTPTT